MGIFDYPAPLFQYIDGLVEFLPAALRLSLWSALAGALSMLLYALVSPQRRIAEVKAQLHAARAKLSASDESFDDLMAQVRRSLSLSVRHLGLVFAPALLSALPLICIIAWCSTQFGYRFPAPSETVELSVLPESLAPRLRWETSGSAMPTLDGHLWRFNWPDDSRRLTLRDSAGAALLDIPPPAAIPQVHKYLWWNHLLGNPAGYLPDGGAVEVVSIDLPAKRYIPVGPAWLGNWLTLFLCVSVAGALATKSLFKIH